MRHLSDIKTLSAITVIVAIISSIAQADRVDTQAGITESYCEACSGQHGEIRALTATAQKLKEIIPNDPRTEMDRTQHPEYNGIGVVQSKIGRGTGFMINECLMLTNKHVIGKHKNILNQKVMFNVGQPSRGNMPFEYITEGIVVASGNPEAKRSDDFTEDWALVKLNKSVGKNVGSIKIGFADVDDVQDECDSLEVAGYPGEKDYNKLWWQGNCKLFPENSGPSAFNIGCPTTPGNSGGPLICKRKNKSDLVVGIASQAAVGNDDKQSYAVNFTVDGPRIAKAIKMNQNCDN